MSLAGATPGACPLTVFASRSQQCMSCPVKVPVLSLFLNVCFSTSTFPKRCVCTLGFLLIPALVHTEALKERGFYSWLRNAVLLMQGKCRNALQASVHITSFTLAKLAFFSTKRAQHRGITGFTQCLNARRGFFSSRKCGDVHWCRFLVFTSRYW